MSSMRGKFASTEIAPNDARRRETLGVILSLRHGGTSSALLADLGEGLFVYIYRVKGRILIP